MLKSYQKLKTIQGLSFPSIQTVQLGANYSWLSCYVYTCSAQLVGMQGP